MGDMRISYSKFLQLLEADRIKRIVVYGDMKTAVVEVGGGCGGVCRWHWWRCMWGGDEGGMNTAVVGGGWVGA